MEENNEEKRSNYILVRFNIFLILGIIAISSDLFITFQYNYIPIIIINILVILYGIITYISSYNERLFESAADSCYYLGFLFTLLILSYYIFSIYFLPIDKVTNINKILLILGFSLSSIFWGFLFRIYIIQKFTVPTEDNLLFSFQKKIQLDLEQLSYNIHLFVKESDTIRKTIFKEVNTTIEDANTLFLESIQQNTSIITRYIQQIHQEFLTITEANKNLLNNLNKKIASNKSNKDEEDEEDEEE